MKIIYLLIACLTLPFSFKAQSCLRTVLSESFALPSSWVTQGSDVSYANGAWQFTDAHSGNYNRALKNLNTFLSDTYFKAECTMSVNPNPAGNGTGAVVLALTSGTLDFMSYGPSQSYSETAQDGIAVVLYSDATDNDMNHWKFMLEAKKSNARLSSAAYIGLSSTINTYFLQLERSSQGAVKLSVFSDAGYSLPLVGSPIIFYMDSTITGLSVLQHGVFTAGSPSRLFDGSIHNSFICDNTYVLATGIAENAVAERIRIFPNPFSSQATVQLDHELSNISTRITDVSGKLIQVPVAVDQQQLSIDGSQLDTGIYFLSIFSEGRLVSSAKLLIE